MDPKVNKILNEIDKKISTENGTGEVEKHLDELNEILFFRPDTTTMDEVKEIHARIHEVYMDWMDINDEALRMKLGVDAVVEMKKLSKKLEFIKNSTNNQQICDKATDLRILTSSYINILVYESTGIAL